jgi:hypothetical protein
MRIAGCGATASSAVAVILACGPPGDTVAELPSGLTGIIVADVGLERPVSVIHDPVDDMYLVANTPVDADAFIARVTPRGHVQKLRWIDAGADGVRLAAPAGMALRGDTLYVADRECIRIFRRGDGKPAGSICPPGAAALNDVTVDPRGRVYVSDTGTGAVYSIETAGFAEVARDPALEQNGGLSAGARGVFVAGAGVYQITPDGLRIVVRDGGKRLGGIVFTRDGSFAFSSHTDNVVVFVEAIDNGTRGNVWTLANDMPSAGDLGYDARRERILIPQTDGDRLMFVDLKP